LQREGGEALDRERSAEDVPDEPRVDRPVHPELELLHQAGPDPDREGYQERRPGEAGPPQPLLVVRAVPEGLEGGDDRPEAERERDEQEMVRKVRAKVMRGRDESACCEVHT